MADPSIRDLAEKLDDLSRLVARQSGALGQLADERRRPGPDLSLLVDLHGLRTDALAAAFATGPGWERTAFESIAAGLERLLAGRGGSLVVPRPGHPFSAATMEAAEEVPCTDTSRDRTVAALLAPGLEAEGRTIRPARVAVHRYSAQPAEDATEDPAPQPDAGTARPDPATGGDEQAAEQRAEQPAGERGDEPAEAADTRRSPAKQRSTTRRSTRSSTRKSTSRKGQPTSAMTSSEISKPA